ncbi:MAG: hypothetical protein WCG48_02095 [Candidatus Berkelbacteria bacterium]
MRKVMFSFFGFAAIMLLVSCSGGGGGGSQDPTDPPIVPPTPPVNSAVTTISPGGTGSVSKDGLTVQVGSECFPSGAKVTLGVENPKQLPPVDEFIALEGKAQVTIQATATPQGEMVLVLAANRGVGETIVAGLVGGLWKCLSLPSRVTDLPGTVRLNRESFGLAKTIVGVVGRIATGSVSPDTALLQYGADKPDSLPRVAVLVHGFNSDAGAMTLLADKLISASLYGRIYVYSYDWRRRIEDTGADFANRLTTLSGQGVKIDVLAHSMGVLVSRYAFEKCDATFGIDQFIGICGPNNGSYLARADLVVNELRNDFLNLPDSARRQGTFATLGIASIEEMMPGSALLANLNAVDTTKPRGSINYSLIGSRSDLVVGYASGIGSGIEMTAKTGGSFTSAESNRGHNSLLSDSSTAQWVTDFVEGSTMPPEVTLTGFDGYSNTDLEGDDWGWVFDLELINNSQAEISLTDISVDEYDRYGVWQRNLWVNDGSLRQRAYFAFNRRIAAGQCWRNYGLIVIHAQDDNMWIEQSEPKNQAKTLVVRVRCYDPVVKRSWCIARQYRLNWEGITPTTPVVRSSRSRSD